MKLFAMVSVGLVSLTAGARLRLNRHQAVGPFEGWEKDVSTFICMKKWSKNWGRDTEQYCLVNLKQMVEASKKGVKSKGLYNMRVSLQHTACLSSPKGKHGQWGMKLCDLKGKEDVRVSYSSRKNVPKACFRIKDEKFMVGQKEVELLEAAISANDCNNVEQLPDQRATFAPTATPAQSIPTSTTVATSVSSSTTMDDGSSEEAMATTSETTTITVTTTSSTTIVTTTTIAATSTTSTTTTTTTTVMTAATTTPASTTSAPTDEPDTEVSETEVSQQDGVEQPDTDEDEDEDAPAVPEEEEYEDAEAGMDEDEDEDEEAVDEDEDEEAVDEDEDEDAVFAKQEAAAETDEDEDAEEMSEEEQGVQEEQEDQEDQEDLEEQEDANDDVDMENSPQASEEVGAEEETGVDHPEDGESVDMDGDTVEKMFEFWKQKEAEAHAHELNTAATDEA